MKLRNKKTGEMGDLIIDKDSLVVRTSTVWGHYSSLTKLNEEWEDMPEEPKTEFYITAWGDIREYTTKEERFTFKQKLEIGNYFETKEEAEKVVEHLRAWKRLKDKGFRFDGWTIDDGLKISICTNFEGDNIYSESEKEIRTNLDLLFSQEED